MAEYDFINDRKERHSVYIGEKSGDSMVGEIMSILHRNNLTYGEAEFVLKQTLKELRDHAKV